MPSIDRLLLMVRRSRHPKLLRYAAAGGAMSIGYTLTVIFFVNGIKCLNPASASACSFALWTPISYFVHRDFTFLFPVANAQLGTFVKFLISFLARLAAAMYIVRFMTIDLGFPYLAGVFANWIALPVIGYIAMNSWVFRVAEQHPIQVDRGP